MRSTAVARCLALGLVPALLGCDASPPNQHLSYDAGGGGGNGGGGGTADADAAAGVADASPNVEVAPPPDGPSASTGCGTAPAQQLGQYVAYPVHLSGATLDPSFMAPPIDRTYAVWLSPSYDPSLPHRTVFVASGCFSTATTQTEFTSDRTRDVIYVGLEPSPDSTYARPCFDNAGAKSADLEYFALVATEVERAFCVDRNDELVAGRYAGGTLANLLGCTFSKADPGRPFAPELALRGQLSVASGLPNNLPACGGPIAALWMHDVNEVNPPAQSLVSLDRVLQANGCSGSPAVPWGTGPLQNIGCLKYTACPAGYPVVFCETTDKGRQQGYSTLVAPALDQLMTALDAAH